MTRHRSPSDGPEQYPEYLVPVLISYGGEDATEDLGSRPYRCPFHGDSTPSATINTAEGWFNCHVHPDCPSGNAVQIIMQREDLTYGAALERATDIAGDHSRAVRKSPGRSGRLAGRSKDRSGTRSLRRTWGSGG